MSYKIGKETFNFSHDRIPWTVNLQCEDVRLARFHALHDGLDRVEQKRRWDDRREAILLRQQRLHRRRCCRLFAQKSLHP